MFNRNEKGKTKGQWGPSGDVSTRTMNLTELNLVKSSEMCNLTLFNDEHGRVSVLITNQLRIDLIYTFEFIINQTTVCMCVVRLAIFQKYHISESRITMSAYKREFTGKFNLIMINSKRIRRLTVG